MGRVVRETAVPRARQAEPPLPSPAERAVQATGSGPARHLADSPFLSPAQRADLALHVEAGRLVVQTPEETEDWQRRSQLEALMSEAIDEFGATRQIAALNTALAEAQGEFPPIPRDREVTVRTRDGRSYSYKYADLGTILTAVRPALSSHGLALTQPIVDNGAGPMLRTELRHADGGVIRSSMKLHDEAGQPQAFGSDLTYKRRYTVTSILGIATEDDDDGNHAQGNAVNKDEGSAGTDAPGKPAPSPPMITKPQKDKIGELIKELTEKWPTEGLTSWADRLKMQFSIRSRDELTKKQAGAAIGWLEEHLKEVAPEPDSDPDPGQIALEDEA